jgi:hypothetical protein
MKRTAPFSKAAIRNACIAAAFAVAPIGLYTVGVIAGPSEEQIAENKAYIPNGYQPTVDLTVSLREEAKVKAEGWYEMKPGIYARWCTETCSLAKVIGSGSYSLMEVWAKDAHAGDIYARVVLLRDGEVVGYIKDTIHLSRGQRGVLTFDSYFDADSAKLTEFIASY